MPKIYGDTVGGGGGGRVQADWSQTDDKKLDYIKNKPTDLATKDDVADEVANLVNSSPETLDALNQLAEALGEDPNMATTIATQIGNKVDKVDGKGLSTNDYTTEEKEKLANITEGANRYTHPDTHPASMITGLATVATSGSYNDLKDKPNDFAPGEHKHTLDDVSETANKKIMTSAEREKLKGVEAGAQANVQPDWAQTDPSRSDYIKNKPEMAAMTGLSIVDGKLCITYEEV